MADVKSILVGMLLGIIIVIGVESAIIALLLRNYSVSPSNALSSLLGSTKAPSTPSALNPTAHSNSITHSAAPLRTYVRNLDLSGNITVRGANLTNEGELHGTLFYNTTLSGFDAASNTTENLTVVIPNYSSLQMLVYTINTGTRNFTIVHVSPQVPAFIKPNSSETFTLAIKLPNGAYSGALNVSFNATLLKVPS